MAAKYVLDLAERVGSTFLLAGASVLVAAGPADLFHASTLQAAGAAGLAAALTLVKGLLARYVGNKDSASLAKGV
jgi:hypothetical protein